MNREHVLSKLKMAPIKWKRMGIKDSKRSINWLPVAAVHSKQLGLSDQGNWCLQTDNKTVVEYSQGVLPVFLLPCLEEPYAGLVLLIQKALKQEGLDQELWQSFPFSEVVCFGLNSRSDYWMKLAMDWLEDMRVDEKVSDTLAAIVEKKMATQKLLHRAQKLLKRLNKNRTS